MDNVAKNATTGDFSLSADGKTLTIEASGLTGNCVMAHGQVRYNTSTVAYNANIYTSGNDIVIWLSSVTAGTAPDLTAVLDAGTVLVFLHILYITSA